MQRFCPKHRNLNETVIPKMTKDSPPKRLKKFTILRGVKPRISSFEQHCHQKLKPCANEAVQYYNVPLVLNALGICRII